MSDDLKFKIIKEGVGESKENVIEKKIFQPEITKTNDILKQETPHPKQIKKFLFIIPFILIISIIFSIYFFIFFKNKQISRNQQANNQQKEDKTIYDIFFNTQTQTIELDKITTPTIDLYQTSSDQENQTTSDLTKSTTSVQTSSTSTVTSSTNTPSSKDEIILITYSNTQTTSSLTTSLSTTSSPPTTSKSTTSEILTDSKTTSKISQNDNKQTLSEPSSPDKNQLIETNIKEIKNQSPDQQLIYLNFPTLEINIEEFNDEGFKKAWLSLLKFQKKAGDIYIIKPLYNNQSLNAEFIKNYFLKPSFIEKKYILNFLQSLGNDYYLLLYYTHTRKFPILIFRINNDLQVTPFMRLWDKETLIKDLKETIFIGLPQGNLIRNFTITETYEGVDYKIAYFDNDYKLIWTLYKNYLIISTSLSAFKYLIKNF